MKKSENQAGQNAAKGNGNVSNWLKWSWMFGALGGAAVVGIVWVTISTLHTNDPVTAKVGSTTIHRSQLLNKLESTSGASTLEEMLVNQLVLDGAKKYKLTATQSEITTAEQNFESQNGITSAAQLGAMLAQYNMTQTQFDQVMKVQVLEQKLSQRGITVTSKEIQDYYNSNKSQFVASGSKTPEPLSKVKSQIKSIILQTKATPISTVIANLAKSEGLKVYDSKYKSTVMADLEPSTSSSSTSNSTGNTTSSATSNSTGN